jgi:hypothetical protein
LHVNTLEAGILNSDETHGSFEWAVTRKFPRVVVFDVAGVIKFKEHAGVKKKRGQIIIEDSMSYLTIAGQTAPSNIVFEACITILAHDILIQHIAVRPNVEPENRDAFTLIKGYNIVLDHISASWAKDELISVGHGAYNKVTIHDVTVSNTLMTDAHKGSIIQGHDISYLNNVYAFVGYRFPSANVNSSFVFVNNYIYKAHREALMFLYGDAHAKYEKRESINGKLNINWSYNVIDNPDKKDNLYLFTIYPYLNKSDISLMMSNNYSLDNERDYDTSYTNDIMDEDAYYHHHIGVNKIKASIKYPTNVITIPNYTEKSVIGLKEHLLNTVGSRSANRDNLDKEIINSIQNKLKFKTKAGSKTAKSRKERDVLLNKTYPKKSNNFKTVEYPHEMYNDNYTNLEHQLHNLSKKVER